MANIKLDFSKMKHVKSDDKSTTLQHPEGHEITLVHSALHPDNQKALSALAGIAKQASQSVDNKMADGGQAQSDQQYQNTIQQRVNARDLTQTPATEPTAWQQFEQGAAQLGQNIKQAVGATPEAEGGEIDNGGFTKKPEEHKEKQAPTPNILDYSKFKKDKPAGGTLNYPDLKKEHKEKNRLAEGGEAETCMHCGGPLHKYAEGDEVQAPPANLDPNSQNPAPDITKTVTPDVKNQPQPSEIDQGKKRTIELYNKAVNFNPGDPSYKNAMMFGPNGEPPSDPNDSAWQTAKKEQADENQQNATNAAASQQQVIAHNKTLADMGLPTMPVPNIPNGPQIPGSPMNPPQPSAVNPAGAPIPDGVDSGMSNALTMSNQGYMQQLLGTAGMGVAQQHLAEQQAKIQDTYAKAEANVLQNYQQSANEVSGEMDSVRHDIENNHITPDKYWTGDANGNGGHSKIAAAIGMIIAGFNPSNKPNAAIDFLKHQMDQNVAAQVNEMGKKQNVLTSLNNKFKNVRDSADFMRLTNAQMAQSQLAKAAAQATGGPNGMAAMTAQQAMGQLQRDYAPVQQRLNMSQAMMKMASQPTGNPDLEVAQATKMARYATAMGNPEMAKQWQEATVPGVGVTKNLAPVSEAVKAQITSHKSVNDLMNIALDMSKQPIPTNPSEYAKFTNQASTVQNQLIGQVKQAQHDGVYKPSEADFLLSQIGGSPASVFRSVSAIPKIEEMQKIKQTEYNNLLQTNNLPIRQLPTSQSAQPQTNQSPDAAVQWAKANPNDPRSTRILKRLGQ